MYDFASVEIRFYKGAGKFKYLRFHEHFVKDRNILEKIGIFWIKLEYFGKNWNILEKIGIFWNTLV